MKADWFVRIALLIIAVSLSVIALGPYVAPAGVMAQSGDLRPLCIEPGTTMLRAPDGSQQVLDKVVVDLRNGNIWGFPTLSPDPYPSAGAGAKLQTSHPFLLGKYALADRDK